MNSSGDPSLLRRLALAFGEGLVFSVGMRLTEDAIRPRNTPVATGAPPEVGPLAERLTRIEHKLEELDRPAVAQIDRQALVAIVGAVEKHLEAHAQKVQERIDALQASIPPTADAAAAKRIEKETSVLREQVVTMQKEVLSSIGQIIASQVAAQVEKRTAALEASLQQTVEAAVAPLRAEVRDLRRQIADTDDTMAEFVSAISDTVRRTSETLPTPVRSDGEWRGAGRVDLKNLRKRLSDAGRASAEPRPLPAPAEQRRGPVPVRQFPVAS
jgi:chromosome segregation ATPase